MRFNVAYVSIMCCALLAGGWMYRRYQQDLPISSWARLGLGIAAFCGAMIGGKLPFVLSDGQGLLGSDAWFADGKTLVCALVGGYLAVEIAKPMLGIRIRAGDSFAVPVAVTLAIGRLACLSAGCCFGIPTELPWGMRCAAIDDELRHPTQLYESLFHGVMAAGLAVMAQRKLLPGQRIKFYFLAYFVFRFLTEFLRPEPRQLAGMTYYQWFVLVAAPIFMVLWMRDARATVRTPT